MSLLDHLARAVIALSAAALLPAALLPAQEGDAPPAPQGLSPKQAWVTTPEIDLGTHLEGEVAHGQWEFRNPHDAAHRFTHFQPSCTCSRAVIHVGEVRYVLENEPRPNTIVRISKGEAGEVREAVEAVEVAPGEAGHIEFHIDLRGVNGPKEASLVVQTDDESNRVLTLRAKATATQFFVVMPPEINLNKMSWKDQRQFTARITSPIQPDFDIVEVIDPLPDQMKVEYRKEMRDGRATWIIDGTYGPDVDPRSGGGVVNFRTNVQSRSVTLRVMAWVEGPLEVRPGGFVPFGLIRHGEGASKEVEFEPTDDFDLQIEKVEFSNLTIDASLITAKISKEGKVCKLTLEVSADAPRRLVRGDVVVHLNHPAAKLQELQFNGFVR
jgi:hypothetical protein